VISYEEMGGQVVQGIQCWNGSYHRF